MIESMDRTIATGPAAQRSDILEVMALILRAATWLNDSGFEVDVDVGRETRRSLPAVPGRTRREAAAASCLSPREREVAALMARGYSNRQIADELFISIATVERHASNIYIKLGFHSRAQVAVWAVSTGLVVPANA